MIRNVLSIELKSEKLNATLANVGAADWLNVNDDVSALDVRLTLKTDDGEFIHVEYQGRSDPTTGSSPRHQHFKPVAKNISG